MKHISNISKSPCSSLLSDQHIPQESPPIRYDTLFSQLTPFLRKVITLSNEDKQIQNEDISCYIQTDTQVKSIVQRVESLKRQKEHKTSQKLQLFDVYKDITGWQLLLGVCLLVTSSLVGHAGIVLMDKLTNILKVFTGESSQKFHICLLLFLTALVYLLKSFIYTQCSWLSAKWKATTNTSLQYLVFTKLLKAQHFKGNSKDQIDSKKQSNVIDNNEEDLDVTNVMTSDIEKQLNLYWAISESISNIISILVLLYLLYQQIGSALFQGLYLIAATSGTHILVTYTMVNLSKRQLSWKDKRVCLSKDVIEGMKSIKYLGWEDIFQERIEDLRSHEFTFTGITRGLDSFLSIFWGCANYFLLYFFLTDYVAQGNNIRESNVFTIIALFGNLMGPVGSLPWSISYLVKSKVSYNRIKRMLDSRDVDTNQVVRNVEDNDSIAISIEKKRFSWNCKDSEDTQGQKNSGKQLESYNEEEEIVELKEQGEGEDDENDNDGTLTQVEQKQYQKQNEENFSLKIQQLLVKKGQLVAVVGKIGSGKSALLLSILNELHMQKHINNTDRESSKLNESQNTTYNGQTIINGSTAYVSQNHWLQNKTVRDNILFGEEFDKQWYDTVVEASDLKTDFNTFAKGDLKVIGPGGGNLSGGQRQRVSICRALYAKKDIYLLDDIFSSLDAHVAEKIYQSAILELLIKKLKKTVILVTSHFGIFTDMAQIDQIVYLKEGQVITEKQQVMEFIMQGSVNTISTDRKEENNETVLNKHKKDDFMEEQQQIVLDVKENEKEVKILTQNNEIIHDQQELEKDISTTTSSTSVQPQQQQQEQEEIQETRQKGGIKLDTFLLYFQTMGIFTLLVFFFSNFAMEASQMLIDFWLSDYVHPKSQIFQTLNDYFISFQATFLFLIFVNITLTTIRGLSYCACALLSSKRLFMRLNKTLIFSKMKFFDKNPVGRIVNLLSNDISTIDDYLPWSCHILMEHLAFSIGYPIGVMMSFPYLIILAVISIILIYFVQKFYRVSNREVKRLNSVNSGKVLSNITEACKGIVEIRAFLKEQWILQDYLSSLHASINTFLLTQAIQIWMSLRLMLISNLIFCCVAFSCGVLIVCDMEFEYSKIAMCLTYSVLLSNKFSGLMNYFCNVEQSSIAVERVRQYLDNEQEEIEKKKGERQLLKKEGINSRNDDYQEVDQTIQLTDVESINRNGQKYAVEFKKVFISYDEKIDQNNLISEQDIASLGSSIQFALKDVSIQIKKGEKIAFCGRTGSGKTSILNALFGMYPIQSGEIFVHGKNINDYSLRNLREQMSIIPQFGFLYKESLLNNLDPGRSIPREIVAQKINATNLHVRQIKEQENKGQQQRTRSKNIGKHIEVEQNITVSDELDFGIEQSGENLSNGEKQIVNFLRVILRETEIICLDEASSNMDPKTDALLHEQIIKFSENKTLIVITHRLENIELFDRVVVMDNGRIVECGNVKELREIEGGFFNRMIKNGK